MFVRLAASGDMAQVAESARALDDVGVDGVMVGDHVGAGRDPLTLLAAVGAVSSRLRLGTMVANISLVHPALMIRRFAELATLFGGDRVVAGLGAGWAPGEFAALGGTMPSHEVRHQRLEETLRLARLLFTDGTATFLGSQVTAVGLPLAPVPKTQPEIMVGGGSVKLLQTAGRLADSVDLNAPGSRVRLGQSASPLLDRKRRLLTTDSDLEEARVIVRDAALAAGREPSAVRTSVCINELILCDKSDVAGHEKRLCNQAGIEPITLASCPYVLVGAPDDLVRVIGDRVERIGLSRLVVRAGPALPWLCEVVGALKGGK